MTLQGWDSRGAGGAGPGPWPMASLASVSLVLGRKCCPLEVEGQGSWCGWVWQEASTPLLACEGPIDRVLHPWDTVAPQRSLKKHEIKVWAAQLP